MMLMGHSTTQWQNMLAETDRVLRRDRPRLFDIRGCGSGGRRFDDPVAEFNRRVRELTAKGMDPQKAKLSVTRSDKALHEALLVATNRSPSAKQMIHDAFAQAAGVR